jgi:uncharacterized membrane protein YkoI
VQRLLFYSLTITFPSGERPMTQSKMIVPTMIVLSLSFAVNALGQEKHIKRSDLPAAVQKTSDEQSKGATVRGYAKEREEGKLEYEVELTVGGHSKDVTIDPAGNVLEVEEQVALEALPAAVRDGLQKKAGNGKITKVETITKHGTLVAYEAQVLAGGKKSEVQVGPGGKPLDHEE